MTCIHADSCTYYNTRNNQPESKQNKLLVESYCEGDLKEVCRRRKYVSVFSKEAPKDLAPNGYLVGTHKKLRIENTRRFKRYRVKEGVGLFQVANTSKTFSAWIVDISEGGMRLQLNIEPQDIDIKAQKSHLKILGYSVEDIPIPLSKDIVEMVWQSDQTIGCSFVAASTG